jgi:rhamnosyltransferase subunit B
MSYYLLVAVGTGSDVRALVGVGAALRKRGHSVTLLASEFFQPVAWAAGLEFASTTVAEEYRVMLETPEPITGRLDTLRWLAECQVLPAIRPVYRALEERAVPGKTVVVSTGLALGARVAQEKLGLPLVSVQTSPPWLFSAYDLATLPGWVPVLARKPAAAGVTTMLDMWFSGPVNRLRRELELKPIRSLLPKWWLSPDRVLALFPEWYAGRQPDWPSQVVQTGFPLYDGREANPFPSELDGFMQEGPGTVVISLAMGTNHTRRYVDVALEACRLLGYRVVLVTGYTTQVPPSLPEWVRHYSFLPFSRLLPRAVAIVHHGGIGTVAQALAAGTPQLIVPRGFDQPDSAARVERLGVGHPFPLGKFRGIALAEAVHRLLAAPGIEDNCRAAAARLTDPGAALDRTADELEAVLQPQGT